MFPLDTSTRIHLKARQKQTREKREHIKISVILGLDAGYSPSALATILGIDDSTIYRYKEKFETLSLDDFLKENWVAFKGLLNRQQLVQLKEHVSKNLYTSAKDVKVWIEQELHISFHEHHVSKILRKLGFCYKKTTLVPGKAKREEQIAHIENFMQLNAEKSENTHLFFNDGVHPQFNTQSEYGWITRGQTFEIPTQAGRQRLNIAGAINANAPTQLYAVEAEAVNSQCIMKLWEKIEAQQPTGEIIHICDNAKYYKSRVLQEWLEKHPRTRIIFLPPYSPNLNPIERVWKLLKKKLINSVCYKNFADFKNAVMDFFDNPHDWKDELASTVTLNFAPIGN